MYRCRKKRLGQENLVRKLKLVLKFMTSQPPAQQKVTIKILPNISQNKSNQTMKFGQL